jgi:hypothetical protein
MPIRILLTLFAALAALPALAAENAPAPAVPEGAGHYLGRRFGVEDTPATDVRGASWIRLFEGAERDSLDAVAALPDGRIAAAGQTGRNGRGNGWLVALDAGGATQDTWLFDGISGVAGLARLSDGSLMLAGYALAGKRAGAGAVLMRLAPGATARTIILGNTRDSLAAVSAGSAASPPAACARARPATRTAGWSASTRETASSGAPRWAASGMTNSEPFARFRTAARWRRG